MSVKDSNSITRDYFDHILLEMRHLDTDVADISVNYWGENFSTPISTAALSHLDNTCENGMNKMAEGAKLAGALCFSGMAETEELAGMCATGAKIVKIIKPHADHAEVLRKIKEAEDLGCFAVGMDIDHAIDWKGEYDVVCDLPMHPKTTEDMRGYVQATKLPFVIKGVLSVADAKKALEIGAKGVIVSHHHGIMDYAIPPLMILPEIVKVLKGKMPIFVDCGIESGMDAFKALALGADGVCVGRAIMGPIKDNGAAGVVGTFGWMNQQLKQAMSRTGFTKISDINSSVIHMRNF